MGKSRVLRLGEIRQVFRIVGACRDVGHDPQRWIAAAMEGLHRCLRSAVTFSVYPSSSGQIADARPGDGIIDIGWRTDRDRMTWLAYLHSGRYKGYLTLRVFSTAKDVAVYPRRALITDRQWWASEERNSDRRQLGLDETMISVNRRVIPDGGLYIWVNRSWNDSMFSVRERRMMLLLNEELAALPTGVLARSRGGLLEGLSPRLREVLESLAEGDSERQVALRIGISRHTVHDLVKELHRRFEVSSRGELLAAYYRRRLPRPDGTSWPGSAGSGQGPGSVDRPPAPANDGVVGLGR